MKCLNCGKPGETYWWLNAYDFQERGFDIPSGWTVEDCFCYACFDSVENKDDLLYNYWLSIQPIEMKEETKSNYYTWHSKVSCKEVSQEFMSNLGQAIQYIWRSNTLKTTKGQSKAEVIADLNKAIDFIKFEIERLEDEQCL